MFSPDQLRIRAVVLDYADYLVTNGIDTEQTRHAISRIKTADEPLHLLTATKALARTVQNLRGKPSPLLDCQIRELRGTVSMLDLARTPDIGESAELATRAAAGQVVRIM